MTVLQWMAEGACVGSGLPWTDEPGIYPAVLTTVMAETCASCHVRDRCSGYAAETATAGFWAGHRRTHPAEAVEPMLPLDPEANTA